MAIPHDNVATTQVIRPSTVKQTTYPSFGAAQKFAGSKPAKTPAAAPKATPRPATQPASGPQQPTQQTGVVQAPANPYDYSSDPVLQAIRAGGIRQRADAESAALAGRKQLAIQLGDATGIVEDQGTAQAAKGNSFSTLQEIMRGYDRSQTATNESMNKANLFYGGARATELGRLLEDRNRQETGARGAAQQQLTGINQTLAQALEAATMQDAQAQSDAQSRALQQALTYGINPGQGTSQDAAALEPSVQQQVQQTLAGTASPTNQLDPWLMALLSGRM